MNWQPIETAPKNGSHILAYWPDVFGVANATQSETWFGPKGSTLDDSVWQTAYEWGGHGSDPTHWMPLPEPPE